MVNDKDKPVKTVTTFTSDSLYFHVICSLASTNLINQIEHLREHN